MQFYKYYGGFEKIIIREAELSFFGYFLAKNEIKIRVHFCTLIF